jgi:hypothetical protein
VRQRTQKKYFRTFAGRRPGNRGAKPRMGRLMRASERSGARIGRIVDWQFRLAANLFG